MTLEEFDKKTEDEKLAEIKKQKKNLLRTVWRMGRKGARRFFETQDDDYLRFFCYDIALPAEHYEMCQLAKEVLESRDELLYDIDDEKWLDIREATS